MIENVYIKEDEADDDHFAIDSITPSKCSSILREHRENGIGGINSSMSTTSNSLRRNRIMHKHTNKSRKLRSKNSPPENGKQHTNPRSMYRFVCEEDNNIEKPIIDKHDDFGTDSSRRNRRSLGETKDQTYYQFDDVSSLHCDEYGYDVKPRHPQQQNQHHTSREEESESDSVSDFFRAPTKQELSETLFRLVEPTPTNTQPDHHALHCLGKLRLWGIVADADVTTNRHLVEFQAVPSLLYFVRGVMEQRRSHKLAYLGTLRKNHHPSKKHHDKERLRQTQTEYLNAANHHELSLHQALQVLDIYTCLGSSSSSSSGESPSSPGASKQRSFLRRAILQQLVEIDGVDLLVTLLEEQLYRRDDLRKQASLAVNHYGHSVAKSIWSILMNVGADEPTVRLLKEQPQQQQQLHHHPRKPQHTMAGRLVSGIVTGLTHRRLVVHHHESSSSSPKDFPETVATGEDVAPRDASLSSAAWMEDLFVVLCRLVGSKDADDVDPPNGTSKDQHNKNQHDELRTLIIEWGVVQKCLKFLMDEPNRITGQDPFVTTLAMSFFYACVRFGSHRYPWLREREEQQDRTQKKRYPNHHPNGSWQTIVEESLDYPRLLQFTLQSVESFPSHHLIQGTGCLLLEAIPKTQPSFWVMSSQTAPASARCCPTWKNENRSDKYDCSPETTTDSAYRALLGLAEAAKEQQHRRRRRKQQQQHHPMEASPSFVDEVLERWYCPTGIA